MSPARLALQANGGIKMRSVWTMQAAPTAILAAMDDTSAVVAAQHVFFLCGTPVLLAQTILRPRVGNALRESI